MGQHGLKLVMAVCPHFEVHREPVGKRVMAAVMLANDVIGDVAAAQGWRNGWLWGRRVGMVAMPGVARARPAGRGRATNTWGPMPLRLPERRLHQPLLPPLWELP